MVCLFFSYLWHELGFLSYSTFRDENTQEKSDGFTTDPMNEQHS